MPLWKSLFATEKTEKRTGLSIAFLDTGISPVADFILPENRIVAFRDLVNGKKEPYDDNGHGTHVEVAKKDHPFGRSFKPTKPKKPFRFVNDRNGFLLVSMVFYA